MKLLKAWLAKHPLKSIVFTWLFGATSAAAVYEWHWVKVFVALLVVFGLVLWRDLRKLGLTAILCLALAMPGLAPEQIPEPPGQAEGPACLAVAVGILVITVGGCATYKLVKFCQKHFPKDPSTNSPTNPTNAVPAFAQYAAAFNFGEIGSCYDDIPCEQTPGSYQSLLGGPFDQSTTFYLDLRLEEDASLTPAIAALRGPQVVQDWASFYQEALALGVEITGHNDGSSFALNSKPITQSDCPIVFDPERKVVKIMRNLNLSYLVTVERSKDLRTWVPLLQTEVEPGTLVRVQDTMPTGQQFYRYRAQLAD